MIHDIYKAFSLNSLDKKSIIYSWLTECGAGLYPYLVMLQHSGRKKESELIIKLREDIFKLRDEWQGNLISYPEIAKYLRIVFDLLNVQIVMIESRSETKWEASMFVSYMNDLKLFIFAMEDEQKEKL